MKHVLIAVVLLITSSALGQVLTKVGPGGTSIVHVECEDALRGLSAASQRDIKDDFDSGIVLRCVASAEKGSGRLSWNDFAYRSVYASDESIHDFRNNDFEGRLGSVSGSTTREFMIGFPDFSRPWILILYLGDDEARFVFVSNP